MNDHTPGLHPNSLEPHHVPHGYAHPKEHHHWYWYAGLAVLLAAVVLIVFAFRQFDHAAPPLCSRQATQVLVAPDGVTELSLAQVSCLGDHMQQRLMIRRGDGAIHTIATFDDGAIIHAGWASDKEVLVSQRGGRIDTFEPIWHDVRIHYKK